MVDSPVLVLNQNYQPLNICQARRAVVLLYWDKAEIVENGQGLIRSANHIFPLPSVIRLVYLVKRPYSQKKLSRMEVFNRDQYICLYCGRGSRELTLDHVIPRHRGGQHIWENVVSACVPCNRRKAGRTPAEAGMRPLREPSAPRGGGFYIPYQYLQSHHEWQRFLPQ
jgi:5-methylcytosine-specific restriction endonuclease McrA